MVVVNLLPHTDRRVSQAVSAVPPSSLPDDVSLHVDLVKGTKESGCVSLWGERFASVSVAAVETQGATRP